MVFPLYTAAGQKEYYSKAMLDGFCFGTAQNVIIDYCVDRKISILQPVLTLASCQSNKLAASLRSPKIAYTFLLDRSNRKSGFKCESGLHIYDVNSRERLFTLDCDREVLDCAFSPNASELVSCSSNAIRLWDVDTGNLLTLIETVEECFKSCNFTCDGSTIVSGKSGGSMELWDIEKRNKVAVFKNDGDVRKCVPLRDELVLAASKNIASVWDTKSGKRVSTMISPPHYDYFTYICDLSVSSDCLTIATASSARVMLWDMRMQKCFAALENGDFGVGCDITLDGSSLVSGYRGSLAIWDIKSGNLVTVTRASGSTTSSCVTFDGCTIVTASSHGVKLWNSFLADPFAHETAGDHQGRF